MLVVLLLMVGLAGCLFGNPLVRAIEAEDLDRVQSLIEDDPEQLTLVQNSLGEVPLEIAVRTSSPEIVRLLLEADRERVVMSQEETSRRVVETAVAYGRLDNLKVVVEYGGNVEPDPDAYRSLLHSAARVRGTPEMIHYLLEQGHPLDGLNRSGYTPLHYAAWSDRPGVMRTLIEAGADPGAVSKNGWTPLRFAVFKCSQPAWDLLVESGADPDEVRPDTNQIQSAREYFKVAGECNGRLDVD